MREVEAREESRRERIERLEQELSKAKQDWIAHKRTQGGALKALIEECLPSTAGKVYEPPDTSSATSLVARALNSHVIDREALVDDIFNMLADNSGRFIRAMNPLM